MRVHTIDCLTNHIGNGNSIVDIVEFKHGFPLVIAKGKEGIPVPAEPGEEPLGTGAVGSFLLRETRH